MTMSAFSFICNIFKVLYYFTKGFTYATVSMVFISILVAEVQRRILRKLLNEDSSRTDECSSSSAIQSSNDIRKNVFYLKRFAELISKDRKRIEEIVQKQDFQIVNALEEQELIQSVIQETFYASILQKSIDQNEEVDKIMKTLDTVKYDFSTCKNKLQDLVSGNPLQVSNSGIIPCIMKEFKDDFTKLLTENKSTEKKMLQTISDFLMYGQADIRKEMILFSSIVDSSETYDDDNFKITLEATLDQMERLKKSLISAHIFISRQCLKVENLQQSVVCFNQKFMYFAVNFDKFLKQSKMVKNNICQQLRDSEVVFTSSTEKLDANASLLLQQAQIFSAILADLKSVLMINKPKLGGLALPMSEHKGRSLTNFPDTTWIDNVDILNRKLENLLHIEENSVEKLESLKRTSTNFENFHNLIKSITRGYNTLLRFFLSTLESSQKFYCDPRMKLKQNDEIHKHDAKKYNMGENIGKAAVMNEKCSGDINVWDEVRKELDSKLRSEDKGNVVFILKDIMTATRKLLDEEQIAPGGICGKDLAQFGDCKPWGDFPSESFITDESSEFLVHSSDESIDRPSEISLME